MYEKPIVIIGAGPAGMSAALKLSEADKPLIVIEKNTSVGGLARTLQYGDFKTDVGPHRFYSQNKDLYEIIEDLLGAHWIKVNRLTRFYIEGIFLLYPAEIQDVLRNIEPRRTFNIIADYAVQKIRNIFNHKEARSFEEKIISIFGKSLAELNMLNYTEKVWGLPCSQISPDWADQRIKGLSIKEIIKNAIKPSGGTPKTLVNQFYYPDSGIGLIFETMKERVLQRNNATILTNSHPVKIIHEEGRIKEIIVQADGKPQKIAPAYIISSIPITELVSLLEPALPCECITVAKKLRFRSHVTLFTTLNRPSIFRDQWLYLPDKNIPFGRIMEPKNFSKAMSPPDKTSLLFEYFCWENDAIWNATEDTLLELTLPHIKEIGFNVKQDIINFYVHKEKNAYPVYDFDYREHSEIIKDTLKALKNLYSIGRGGSFMYNNTDHSMTMGIMAAKSIIEGKHYDFQAIGAEKKYFERGDCK